MPAEDEITLLAEHFKKLWREGNAIRPWLRKHADMLVNLVHDDWSWAGLAEALTLAGITYRTGRPWKAEQLRVHIATARLPLKSSRRKNGSAAALHDSVPRNHQNVISESDRFAVPDCNGS